MLDLALVDFLQQLEPGDSVRIITSGNLITGKFVSFEDECAKITSLVFSGAYNGKEITILAKLITGWGKISF